MTERRHYRSNERHRIVGTVNADVSKGDVADAVAKASTSWLSPVVLLVGQDGVAHIHAQGMAAADRAIKADRSALVGTYDTTGHNRNGHQRVRFRVIADLGHHLEKPRA